MFGSYMESLRDFISWPASVLDDVCNNDVSRLAIHNTSIGVFSMTFRPVRYTNCKKKLFRTKLLWIMTFGV